MRLGIDLRLSLPRQFYQRMDRMSAQMDALNASVALAVQVMGDAATLIAKMANDEKEDPAALRSAADALKASADALKTVVDANP